MKTIQHQANFNYKMDGNPLYCKVRGEGLRIETPRSPQRSGWALLTPPISCSSTRGMSLGRAGVSSGQIWTSICQQCSPRAHPRAEKRVMSPPIHPHFSAAPELLGGHGDALCLRPGWGRPLEVPRVALRRGCCALISVSAVSFILLFYITLTSSALPASACSTHATAAYVFCLTTPAPTALSELASPWCLQEMSYRWATCTDFKTCNKQRLEGSSGQLTASKRGLWSLSVNTGNSEGTCFHELFEEFQAVLAFLPLQPKACSGVTEPHVVVLPFASPTAQQPGSCDPSHPWDAVGEFQL